MARRNTIIRHLAAVESLGSADVIASDKTGTLTRNEMTARTIVTASGRVDLGGTGYAPVGAAHADGGRPIDGAAHAELVQVLSAADRASNAVLQERDGRWSVQGDPTEGALIVAARKAGLEADALDRRFTRIGEVPFSSERKLMSTVQRDAEHVDRLTVFSKGAPDVLLTRCTHEMVGTEKHVLLNDRRAEILAANERLTGEALRTLAVATRTLPADAGEHGLDDLLEHELTFLGLIGMIDPPRPEAKAAVRRARAAGVRAIMITGDHPGTAAVIASELDIAADGRTISGADLERMSAADLDRIVREVSVYARVNPEHKLRIVDALQRGGLTVAMTGDGVNDAPALKHADIGIAMGITGTDVSKQAADMVLADDNFATIVAAVEEGRAIFANIRKFLRYLLSSNIGEVLTMFFGVMLVEVLGLKAAASEGGLVLPLLATQILWINLVTDGAPALALGIDSPDRDVMTRPPRPRGEGVITGQMWLGILLVASVMAAGTLLVLDASLPGGLIEGSGTLRYGQTMAFTTLMMFQLFNVFNARSDVRSAFADLFRTRSLWLGVGLSLLLHVCVIYVPFLQLAFSTVPLGLGEWLLCTAVASSVLWIREGSKALQRAISRSRTAAPLAVQSGPQLS
jgi:Ca2+-transporting ATPase